MDAWLDKNRAWLRSARRWIPKTSEPLRIRTWLASPVACDGRDPITIEGALQFAVVVRETGRLPDDVFAGASGLYEIPIPVDDVDVGGRLIACASWGIPAECAVFSTRTRRKRARVESYGVGRITVKGGWAKSLNIPIGTIVTPYIDFFVRGDRTRLEDLLRDVGGLGRDSTRGLGTVLGHEVSRSDDRSVLYRGAPQRSIPLVNDGPFAIQILADGTWEERETTTRAPYWHRATKTRCAVPVQRVAGQKI